MNTDIIQALSKKVDDWQFHSIQSKVSTLESQNVQLQREIGNLEGRINSQMRAITDLLSFILEKGLLPEHEQQLWDLKNYL